MTMSKEIINNCIQEQCIETINIIFSNKNKQKLSADEIIKEFEKMWASQSTSSTVDTVKPKKQQNRKELSPSEQCHALKKDTTRCKGRKFNNGSNPLLCSLHNTRGIQYGIILESDESHVESHVESIEPIEPKKTKGKSPKKDKFIITEDTIECVDSDNEVYNEEFN